jgi:nucleotide-binding universal stress UspA family protein
MYGTIPVAFDGSEDTHRTLDHVVELARIVGATLHVVAGVEQRGNPMKSGVVETDELNRTEADLVDEIAAAYGAGDVEGDPSRSCWSTPTRSRRTCLSSVSTGPTLSRLRFSVGRPTGSRGRPASR